MKPFSKTVIFYFLLIHLLSCNGPEKVVKEDQQISNEIICTNSSCKGFYEGPEFINGSDVAHQFSNTMSAKVGE